MTATDLDIRRIAEAARVIDPVFLNSPQFVEERLCSALGREVLVKVETLNPIHSFKGRGADFFIQGRPRGRRIICASSGNFGQAMAYACRRRGIQLEVVVPSDANPVKVARMRRLGARVTMTGEHVDATAISRAQECADADYAADGQEPAVAEGAGSIGVELLSGGEFDTVVLPVGDGALISGVACWIKGHRPDITVIGVCAEGAPSMMHSWRAGAPVPVHPADTIAEGLAIHSPAPQSLQRVRSLVDDLVTVPDAALTDMMQLAAETLGVLLEPSGAAGLAAIATYDLPGERLATVLTGGDPRPHLVARLTQRLSQT